MAAIHLTAPVLSDKQIKRFWSKIARRGPAECWLWTACCNNRVHGKPRLDGPGYGVVRLNSKNYSAHAIALWLTTDVWPNGLHTLHNCPDQDCPSCCNPSHLYLGTQKENARDTLIKKQRQKKHTPEQIAEVRRLHATGLYSLRCIARTSGLERHYLKDVLSGKYWKDLT